MVDGSGSLTFDVLSWLGEQGVALIHVDWRGEVLSVMGNHGFAADRQKVQWQMDTCADPARRLAFSNDLVVRKLENSIVALNSALAVSPRRDAAIVKAHTAINQIKFNPPADMTCLRHIEATSARVYFGAWRGLEIRWKATGRQPIPDRWRAFETRTSIANGLKDKNVNASDPLNAMLNYAYGVLQCRLQIGAVADGFDPTIGIMHHARRDAAAYVFDLMEPERPKVDAAILAFVAANTFSGADFTIREDGVCRLSPQLARVVCALADATPSVAARH
jgi:CRISPR-associated endonuclease Cas1